MTTYDLAVSQMQRNGYIEYETLRELLGLQDWLRVTVAQWRSMLGLPPIVGT